MTDASHNFESEKFSAPTWPMASAEVEDVFRAMMADGTWGRYHGPHCDALMLALQEYHQVEHAVLCSSGTSAVELALRAVPVEAGDEVVMCAYDFKANFINVVLLGAVPVLVDTLPGSPVIDTEQIASACTSKTKAILVSHLHGTFADIDKIRRLADERGIILIEDACQATGALIGMRRVATYGHIGVLSFGGSKLLTCGRGGAVLSNDAAAIQRIRLYTQRGNEAYPLSEMQSAILLPQLQQLDEYNLQRLNAARRFAARLNASSDKEPNLIQAIVHEADEINGQPSYYKLAVRCEAPFPIDAREQFCHDARSYGIPIDPAFSGLHLIHSRKRFQACNDLPNATQLHDRLMGLHHTALLLPETEIDRMADVLRQLAAKYRRQT